MTILHDEAIVLHRLDYSETSQVLVLFTPTHGKVRAIGKGIKRGTKSRIAVGIDLLERGTAVFSTRGERSETLATLTEWKPRSAFLGLRERLPRLYAAQYAAQLTAQLTADWDPHPALFEALGDCLLCLAEADEVLGVVVAYQQVLLREIGLQPRFDCCSGCGRSTELTHFSSLEGGLLCRHCEPAHVEKRELTPDALALLRESPCFTPSSPLEPPRAGSPGEAAPAPATPAPGPTLPSAAVRGAFDVLNYHIAHILGREPQLADLLVPPAQRRRLH
ncbi:MAG TPA: DNA repair protein RecO [Phycisphaerae bacterium]|nr:DNA repair protein RecO [Phycisphaerae bacterium]HNU43844.1 DNA repair protein RecO [Phycisphaerae bacterium]